MFVLLQVYPPEATAEDGSDDCCCLDVIAVAPSEAELERFLAAYEPRYQAACREFGAWDADLSADWGEAHDRMLEELAAKHGALRRSEAARSSWGGKIRRCLSCDTHGAWDGVALSHPRRHPEAPPARPPAGLAFHLMSQQPLLVASRA